MISYDKICLFRTQRTRDVLCSYLYISHKSRWLRCTSIRLVCIISQRRVAGVIHFQSRRAEEPEQGSTCARDGRFCFHKKTSSGRRRERACTSMASKPNKQIDPSPSPQSCDGISHSSLLSARYPLNQHDYLVYASITNSSDTFRTAAAVYEEYDTTGNQFVVGSHPPASVAAVAEGLCPSSKRTKQAVGTPIGNGGSSMGVLITYCCTTEVLLPPRRRISKDTTYLFNVQYPFQPLIFTRTRSRIASYSSNSLATNTRVRAPLPARERWIEGGKKEKQCHTPHPVGQQLLC